MSIWPRALLSFGPLAGAAMIAAVQIPPDTATSNLSAWARAVGFFGFTGVTGVAFVLPSRIDQWIAVFGVAAAVVCIVLGILMRIAGKDERSRKRKSRR